MKKIQVENKKIVFFLKSAKLHIRNMDAIMKMPEGYERGKKIATELNRFNFDLDSFLHFGCGIPLKKLNGILNKSFRSLK